MAAWRTLTNYRTGFAFAQASDFGSEGCWSWVVDTLERQFECREHEIGSIEDDDGRELITVRGEPVAELHYGLVHNVGAATLPTPKVALFNVYHAERRAGRTPDQAFEAMEEYQRRLAAVGLVMAEAV